LKQIEGLKRELEDLQIELQQATQAAELAARRSRRLGDRSQELQAYALEHVTLGDEEPARAALMQKAAVAEALEKATQRTRVNSALAAKLEQVRSSSGSN
jgi:phage shock protein A